MTIEDRRAGDPDDIEAAQLRETLRELERTAQIGTWSLELDGNRITWSDEMYRMVGWTPGTPVDVGAYRAMYHPEDAPRVMEAIARATETGAAYSVEYRIVLPGGSTRWIQGKGTAIRDEAGKVTRIFGTAQDVTDRKAAEEQSRNFLREQVARNSAEAAESRMRFVAEASVVLASSLDYETTLRNVARLAVPAVADWCAVDLVDDEGNISRLAVEHSDPEKVRLIHLLEELYPSDPSRNPAVPEVVRTGRTSWSATISDAELEQAAVDDRHFSLLRQLGLASYAIVPLAGRQDRLGAITFVYAESNRVYGEEDIPLLEDLSRRAALAIETARLIQEQEAVSVQLQSQAAALEAQTEELQQQAVQLEEVQAELEVTNAELREANDELTSQAAVAIHDRREKDALLASTSEGIYGVDGKGKCTFVNRAACEMLGFDREELLGQDMHALIHHTRENGTPYPVEECPIYRAVGKGDAIRADDDVLWRKDGTMLHVAYSAAPILAGEGPPGIVVTFHDNSDRRLAEDARREETRIVDALHRIGQSLTTQLDLENVVQEVTDTATSLTGARFGAFFYNTVGAGGETYTLYTISGVPKEEFSRFPMPRDTAIFGPTFRGEGIVRSDDITKDPRYGQTAPYFGMPEGHLPVTSYLAIPVVSRSGEVIGGLFFGHEDPAVFGKRQEQIAVGIAGWAAVAMDNARLYEGEHLARTAAEDANRAKSDFLATISHELRTPLNAMIGYTDLLLEGIPVAIPPEASQKVERIAISAHHLRELIEEILTFSRLEAGEERIVIETVEIASLLSEVRALSDPLAEARGLDLTFHPSEEVDSIQSDTRKILQIVLNLVGNAIKFTPAGSIDVRATTTDEEVRFIIEDTGPGIEEQFLERIFEPFFQVESGATRTLGGTGLGLGVTRRLARLIGGDVTVESTTGEGSVFTVHLPKEPPATSAGPPEDDGLEQGDASPTSDLSAGTRPPSENGPD